MIRKITPYRIKKGLLYLKQYGAKEFCIRLRERFLLEQGDYGTWYEKHKATEAELKEQRKTPWKNGPKISIVVPVYHTPSKYLLQMLDSVCAQTYSNWELCIANADPGDAMRNELLETYCEKEKRIHVINLCENCGIAENTNAAIGIANGTYIGFLDHDDLLAPDALFEIASRIQEDPQTDMLYTDEDKVRGEALEHFQPHFKPDFNLDLLRANNYICHFCVIRKELIEQVGGLHKEYNGAQDHDLFLRCIEQTEYIAHIPKVLYHWRVHEASTADNPMSKSYAYEAGKKAIAMHLKRCEEAGKVTCNKDLGFYRVQYKVQGKPVVARSEEEEGEYLLIQKGVVLEANEHWMEELLSNCQRKNVGVAGAKIYDTKNRVQHAGMHFGYDGRVAYTFAGLQKGFSGYMHKANLQQNVSVVSAACMMVKRSVYEEVGGLDQTLPAGYAELDFCLKVLEKGYLVIFDPYAQITMEPLKQIPKEVPKKIKERWGEVLEKGDPMYYQIF